jgi:antitoxin component of RelBE/YafQ-DinJ toxin-antitoxin module
VITRIWYEMGIPPSQVVQMIESLVAQKGVA